MNNSDFDLLHPQLNNYSLATAIGEENRPNKALPVRSIPLRRWIREEGRNSYHHDPLDFSKDGKASLIRKVTVAYAVAKVLQHVSECRYSIDQILRLLLIDNFAVRVYEGKLSDLGWEVEGVYVISPELAVQIRSNWQSSISFFDGTADDLTGRNVQTTITSNTTDSHPHHARPDAEVGDCDERMICYYLGRFLHSFFCGVDPQRIAVEEHGRMENDDDLCDPNVSEPSMKKNFFLSPSKNSAHTTGHSLQKDGDRKPRTKETSSNYQQMERLDFSQMFPSHSFSYVSLTGSDRSKIQNTDESFHANFYPLLEAGYPPALSQVVINLLECGSDLFRSDDFYQSLEDVTNDLHILLEDPGRFLFDQFKAPSRDQALVVDKEKLYDRAKETALLTDAFCRVALSGNSEAVCVSGFSGCGKTRLVQSVFESVDASGGYLVVQKFDETPTQSPLSVVLSALNDLCGMIVEKKNQDELRELYENITNSTNLALLSRVLPNIVRMNSSDTAVHPVNQSVSSGMNFHMLVFAVMRLMRIISSRSRPVMIFLDDLQWADTASLDLVHAILSDVKGSNCVFFVGSYRDQDVKQGHFVDEFMHSLSAYEVRCTELHLDGLTEDALNQMLSDALCVTPRLCKSLSSIVYYKTRGSPFFTFEFLNSLIDRGIVIYSLRERRWIWDVDQIHAEDITDNVLQMISDKMAILDDKDKKALEVAACFGIKINESFARDLSRTPMYTDLQSSLDKAVENGFMERDDSNYRFVHDKVREAAYLSIDSKDEYHFNLGMALYSIFADKNDDNGIATRTLLAHINHGIPSLLTCKETRSYLAQLNYKESLKSFGSSDFTSAYQYIKAAISLSPEDSWSNHHDQRIKFLFQFANAAFPCGRIQEAKDSLNEIIENGRGIHDTFPSYILLAKILFSACNDLSQAFAACRMSLQMLGEDVPDVEGAKNNLTSQVAKAKTLLKDSELLHSILVQTDDWRILAIMQAYDQLVTITYTSHPNVMPHYAGRWVQFTVVNRVSCRYTSKCIVTLGAILCRDLSQDARIAYRSAKKALASLDYSHLDVAASVFLTFYGLIGGLFEPIQACIDMLRRGYEMAMQAGNLSVAAFLQLFVLSRSIRIGANLSNLQKEIDIELKMATHRSQTFMTMRLRFYRETVLALIGEESSGHSALLSDEYLSSNPSLVEALCLNEALCSAYLGNPERIHHLSKRYLESLQQKRYSITQRSVYIIFYFGLSTAATYRNNGDPHQLRKLDYAISIVAKAAKFSEWNFKNKASLLKAELASLEEDNDEADEQYDFAIAAARSSKFINEEGLACELAGLHCKKHGKVAKAFNLFSEAERCYQAWGSTVKAHQMTNEINSLTT
ncbi:hypothetical protein HJC23_007362 [Cyclotella cryptica]|uniref:Orc1-like AAA ATPase domain-containing protein n=1 Tax=Cyclotella cryptica TaxID=29204 RepID=A0ABD3Q5G5_9STRA